MDLEGEGMKRNLRNFKSKRMNSREDGLAAELRDPRDLF